MEREINLVDLGFKDLSIEEKREIFMLLDIVMQKYHENNYMISSFNPKDIYYENGMFGFSKYNRISTINANDKSDAILNNIIGLSNLAFCSYLPSYDFDKGLLNIEAINKNYDKFENLFIPMDKGYYRSVLVDSVNSKRLPETPYYYDYINNVMKNTDLSNRSNSNVRSYVKATEAGKLLSEQDNEAAFSSIFYLVCMVTTSLVAFIGIILYFIK